MLALHDALAVAVVACIVSSGVAERAYAYVDPSVMTYTIQALAGVAVALGAVAGVAFRRSRRALMKALGIDENARKEKEPALHRLAADGTPVANVGDGVAPAAPVSSEERVAPSKVSKGKPTPWYIAWFLRLLFAIPVAVLAVFTAGFVAPVEIIAASSGSLVVGVGDVWPVILRACLIATGAIVVVLSLLRGKAYMAVFMLLFAFGLCCYIQALFLNGGLPTADGNEVLWWSYKKQAFVSLGVWIAMFVILVYLGLRFENPVRTVTTLLCLALIVMQGAGAVSAIQSAGDRTYADGAPVDGMYVTEEGLFTVSSKDNIIVFVLDTIDTRNVIDLTTNGMSLFDEYTGFTWYRNTAGAMVPTRYGAPFLLTGVTPDPDEDWKTFITTRYTKSSFLADVDSCGYSIGIYTDSLCDDDMDLPTAWETIGKHTKNVHGFDTASLDETGVVVSALKVGLYRDLLWPMKPFFWFYTDEVNSDMVKHGVDVPPDSALYIMDDPGYFSKLKSRGIAAEDDGETGAFRFIHLNGTHDPFIMDENGNRVPEKTSSTVKQQATGSFRVVAEYLRQMKELGLYDDATIIVTADHGDWFSSPLALQEPTSPILFVKPSQDAAEASQPLAISDAPVAHKDVLATVVKAAGMDTDVYGPAVEDVPEGERTRIYYALTVFEMADDDILEYRIDGDVLDFSNWHLTGTLWQNVWEKNPAKPKGQPAIHIDPATY